LPAGQGGDRRAPPAGRPRRPGLRRGGGLPGRLPGRRLRPAAPPVRGPAPRLRPRRTDPPRPGLTRSARLCPGITHPARSAVVFPPRLVRLTGNTETGVAHKAEKAGDRRMTGSRIRALGHYQPTRVLTNDDVARLTDTSDQWIRSRVGIRTRHVAAPEETVDEMAAHAGAKALANAGLEPGEVGMIVVATSTAVDRSPNMASRVAARLSAPSPAGRDANVVSSGFPPALATAPRAARLGAAARARTVAAPPPPRDRGPTRAGRVAARPRAPAPAAPDVNGVGSGDPHALATADHAIRAGAARTALVIGSRKMTDVVAWEERSTSVLVGDGAGAALLTAAEEPEIGPVHWGSFPELGEAVRIGGTPTRFVQEGQTVYRWTTTRLPELARAV